MLDNDGAELRRVPHQWQASRADGVEMRPICFALAIVLGSSALQGLETDQFTLPAAPLTDSGVDLSEKVARAVSEIVDLQDTVVLDEARIAEELYRRVGSGTIKTEIEKFIDHALPSTARFNPPVGHTIYRGVLLPIPGGLIVRAPTIKVFGYEVGSDKVGHLVQQGYEYYKVYRKSPGPTGVKRAVEHGVLEERTIFGTAVSGVYSNADLAANFAGLKFYLNLTEPVDIGGATLEPILIRSANRWELSPRVDVRELLKPYVSGHWNEALNPSEYRMMHPLVAKAVQKRCSSWHMRLGDEFSPVYFAALMAEYSTWHGEEYGHRYAKKHGVSLADECFKDENAAEPQHTRDALVY